MGENMETVESVNAITTFAVEKTLKLVIVTFFCINYY